MLSIESFVDAPQDSPLLICFPSIAAGPELDFVRDVLRMMIDGPIDAFAIRRQYIQEAGATRRMENAETNRIAAIGWFPLLGFFPPEKTLLALWQQLPLALRPELSDLKQRLDEIQVVQQRESWGYRRRARQQKIRRFVASLNANDFSGSPA